MPSRVPLVLTLAIVAAAAPALAKDARHPFDLWQRGALRGANIGEFSSDADPEALRSAVDPRVLRGWGANLVTFCFADSYDTEPPYALRPHRFAAADAFIQQAAESGIYVVIVTFHGPGLARWDDYRVYHDAAARAAWGRMWQDIAAHYKGNPAVVGYDIMGEPHPEAELTDKGVAPEEAVRRLKGTDADWNLFARQVTKAIRAMDPYTPILVESAGWGYPQFFGFLEPTSDPGTVYVTHFYSPRRFTHQGVPGEPDLGHPLPYPGIMPGHFEREQRWDRGAVEDALAHVRRFQQRHHVPIFAGEFGCVRWAPGALDYLRDVIGLYEQWGWSWAYWRFRGDYDVWDIEKLPDRSDAARHAHTPMLDLYRSFFSRNREYLQHPAPGPPPR